MQNRVAIAAFAACLFYPFISNAADDPAAILVTATRFSEVDPMVAANTTVITRQDIRTSPAQNLTDVLSLRAGIDVKQFGGAMGRDATVDVRGFGATATSNTLILVDGLRVNPVDSGSIIWSAIPLERVDRVEIIRGSGTVLYGDGATGGVINIITDKSGRPVKVLTAKAGGFGYKGADVQMSDGSDRAYYNLVVNYAEATGYRLNGQQDQKTASGRTGLLLDRGEVFADFASYRESAGQPGSIFNSAYRDDPRSTRTPFNTEKRDGYRVRPGVSYRLNDRLTLDAEVAVDHQELESKYASIASGSLRVRDTSAFTPRLRWHHDLASLTSETVLGLDFYDGKVTASNIGFANQGAAQKSSALYVQNITRLTPNLSLTLGDRSQRMVQKANQEAYAPWFSPAMDGRVARTNNAYDIGLTYATNKWRVYGKSGTTFRFANIDELFGFDPILFVPVFAGDLRPQHGRVSEVGGSMAAGSANLRASIYRMDLTDEIAYDDTLGANTNLSPTRRQGAEFEADWKIADSLQANLSYAHTEGRFRDGAYVGKIIPLVPRDHVSVQVTWNTGPGENYTAVVRRVGERRYGTDFDNARGMLPAYATLDLQAVWNLKPWRVTAKLLNALDKKYSPVAGYSAFYRDTYYYPADPRSLFLSGRFDF